MSERCCGNCIHHLPTKRIPRIKKMTYNTSFCFWDCNISKRPKRCEQGKECKLFEDRYEPEDRSDEWIEKIYTSDTGGG